MKYSELNTLRKINIYLQLLLFGLLLLPPPPPRAACYIYSRMKILDFFKWQLETFFQWQNTFVEVSQVRGVFISKNTQIQIIIFTVWINYSNLELKLPL